MVMYSMFIYFSLSCIQAGLSITASPP